MTSVLKAKPEGIKVETGVGDPRTVAEALEGILADTYSLMIKTHGVHWNVEGPMFYAVHNLTEEQYGNLFSAADVIAERMRALGHLAPMSRKALLEGSVVKDVEEADNAIAMCRSLADDHTTVAKRLHGVIEIAGETGDPVTEDLATERAAFHEKAAWMLRALAHT